MKIHSESIWSSTIKGFQVWNCPRWRLWTVSQRVLTSSSQSMLAPPPLWVLAPPPLMWCGSLFHCSIVNSHSIQESHSFQAIITKPAVPLPTWETLGLQTWQHFARGLLNSPTRLQLVTRNRWHWSHRISRPGWSRQWTWSWGSLQNMKFMCNYAFF